MVNMCSVSFFRNIYDTFKEILSALPTQTLLEPLEKYRNCVTQNIREVIGLQAIFSTTW